MGTKRVFFTEEKKPFNINVFFLSFRNTFLESAGAKRIYYQASFLSRFVEVNYLIPKNGKDKTIKNINVYYGICNVLSRLKKARESKKKNILMIGTLIELKHFPFVIWAKILGYKIIFDKVENYKYFKDKKTLGNSINIKFGLFLDNWLNFFADGLLVISSKLNEIYYKNDLPTLLMPNSVPIDNVTISSKKQFGKPVKILYSGTYGLKEGVELLVEAFNKISKKYNDVELHLVGKGTSHNEDRIKFKIKENNQIYWHGYVPNEVLTNLQNDSDILPMTRLNSKFAQFGFPYKVTEYLTTGNTIIATNIGDISDFLSDKVSAVIAEPNVNSIYDSIEFCLNNVQESIKIGKNGQKEALKAFDIELNGKKLLNFLINI